MCICLEVPYVCRTRRGQETFDFAQNQRPYRGLLSQAGRTERKRAGEREREWGGGKVKIKASEGYILRGWAMLRVRLVGDRSILSKRIPAPRRVTMI